MNKSMLGYVLVTRGKRHNLKIADMPGAQRQVANLRQLNNDKFHGKLLLTGDYTRHVGGLSSLPVLNRHLALFNEHGQGEIMIDDLSWLFCHSDHETGLNLLKELDPFSPYIFGIKQGRCLRDLTHIQTKHIVLNRSVPFRYKRTKGNLSRSDALAQTENATATSIAVRNKKALAKAKELTDLSLDLQKAGQEVSHASLAREANERGLLTNRGGQWSRGTVGSALKRLSEHEKESQA